ncbi:MAG: DMT family transporter [Thermodesulfobacteriota bacterium]
MQNPASSECGEGIPIAIEENATHPKYGSALKGILLLTLLSLFWGLAWPAMKIVLSEVRPWTFRTICLLAGGGGLLALARMAGSGLKIPLEDLKPLLITALFNITGWHMFSAYGIARMHAGRAAILAYTMPIWAILLSRLMLREKLTAVRLFALTFGFAGLFLLLWPDIRSVEAAPEGALFILGAAFCWAAGTVMIKFFTWHMPVSTVMGWQLLLGGIPVVFGAFLIEPLAAILGVSWNVWLALIFIVSLPIIFCHWAFFTVVQIFPASVAALSTLAVPAIGVFSSALLLGEPIEIYELAALGLVVVSLGLTGSNFSERRRAAEAMIRRGGINGG